MHRNAGAIWGARPPRAQWRARRPARLRTVALALGLDEDACVVTSARTLEGMEELRESVLAFLA